MKMRIALPALVAVVSISGCGGGGSSSPTSSQGTASPAAAAAVSATPAASTRTSLAGQTVTVGMGEPVVPPPDTGMLMSCADGAGVQCSGNTILATENGVALTSSGVQVSGKSTNDLAAKIENTGLAKGLVQTTVGTAEVRVFKNATGTASAPALLLDKFGISWDGVTDRPQILETFATEKGRVALDATGKIIRGPLPDASEISFYDFAVKGRNATQYRYANNTYFPRDLVAYPVRCPIANPACRTTGTDGWKLQNGNWRSGGTEPDSGFVFRLHEDGNLYAGDGLPNPDGSRKPLPGGDGFGVSFPGFKGYRVLENWGMQYGSLATWFTQDTVNIAEFAGGSSEHNKSRRGAVAFGDVTSPAMVPNAGTATYGGTAYGWYAANATDEAVFFKGAVTITVNFAAHTAVVTIQNTLTLDQAQTSVPATLSSTIAWAPGPSGNYLTGAVATNGNLTGGASARYFGPVIADGSGNGPAEAGGTYVLSNAATGQTVIAGFIARKL
jgi:hypothetical protein